MPDYIDDDVEVALDEDIDAIEDEIIEEEEPEEELEEQPIKYAGKFKTDKDLEKGYLEAQRAMTQAQQEASELRRQIQQAQQQQVAIPDDDDDGSDEFFENPKQAFKQWYDNNRRVQKLAELTIKRILNEYSTDPMYDAVKNEFESALMEIDDNYIIQPDISTEGVRRIYNMLCGEVARGKMTQPKAEPKRQQADYSLESTNILPDSIDLTNDERQVLKNLGITDAKKQAEIITRMRKKG